MEEQRVSGLVLETQADRNAAQTRLGQPRPK